MALKVEGVMDSSMHVEKALSRAGRLDSLHFLLAPSHGLVGILGAVVRPQPLLIAARMVRASEDSFAVEFIDVDKQRDALIRKLCSGRYYRRRGEVRTSRLFGAVMARALR